MFACRLNPYPQTFDRSGKGLPGINSSKLRTLIMGVESFITLRPELNQQGDQIWEFF
jgi:hypothetical protein